MVDPTVLVVDDEPKTRQSFAALISSLGLPVEAFASGEELLGRLDIDRPGCSLVDFRLPRMDGVELHRRLLDAGCHLPVILISACLNVQTAIGAMRQGVFRVLEKPYRDDELANAILDAIEYDRMLRIEKQRRLDFEHRLESLDARERLTMEMIIAGSANRAIERRLGLSTRTVDRIRASILEKMSFLSFVELSADYGATCAAGQHAFPTSFAESDGPSRRADSVRTETVVEASSLAEATPDVQSLRYDLHDGTAHYLIAALMRVQAIEARSGIVEELRPCLHETGTLLSMALAEVRDIIAGKSLGLPRQSELVPAIEDLFKQLAIPHGIEVEFRENLHGERLPPLTTVAAYRILQECLNNAVSHSGSKRLRVEIDRQPETLRLAFRDWGRGFNLDAVGGDHRGLQGIRHRAESLGGTATVRSEPRQGTLVSVELPLEEARN